MTSGLLHSKYSYRNTTKGFSSCPPIVIIFLFSNLPSLIEVFFPMDVGTTLHSSPYVGIYI